MFDRDIDDLMARLQRVRSVDETRRMLAAWLPEFAARAIDAEVSRIEVGEAEVKYTEAAGRLRRAKLKKGPNP